MYGYFVEEKKAFTLFTADDQRKNLIAVFFSRLTLLPLNQPMSIDVFLRCTEMCVEFECFRTAASI